MARKATSSFQAPRSRTRKPKTGGSFGAQKGKIRGARKVDELGRVIVNFKEWKERYPDALYFDSLLEWRCFNYLSQHKIKFELKRKYTIQPGFVFHGERVLPITWTPDFYLTDYDMIWETKGYANDGFGNKLKNMKYMLSQSGQHTRIEVLSSLAEIIEAHKRLNL